MITGFFVFSLFLVETPVEKQGYILYTLDTDELAEYNRKGVIFMARKSTGIKNISYDKDTKKYYATFYFGQKDNKPVKKYQSFATLQEAKAALAVHEAAIATDTAVAPSNYTLGSWMTYVIETLKANADESTLRGYRNILNRHIIPSLGDIPLQKIKPQQLEEYYVKKIQEVQEDGKTLSSNTVYKHHELIRLCLRKAFKYGEVSRCVTDLVDPPRKHKTPILYYDNIKKIDELIDATGKYEKFRYLKIVVVLAAYLGLRRSEIASLEYVTHINFDDEKVHILNATNSRGESKKHTKNDSSMRVLPMSDIVKAALLEQKAWQDQNRKRLGDKYIETGRVVTRRDGHWYNLNRISEDFSDMVKQANLPKVTLHGLRHSFATIANSMGVPLRNISAALGHSNISTTGDIYTEVFEESQKDYIKRIGAFR